MALREFHAAVHTRLLNVCENPSKIRVVSVILLRVSTKVSTHDWRSA